MKGEGDQKMDGYIILVFGVTVFYRGLFMVVGDSLLLIFMLKLL